jgi:hypothetical protein
MRRVPVPSISTVNSAISVTNGTANLLIENNMIAGFLNAIKT